MWRNVRTTDIGVVGGGLTTTVLPAMSAYGRLAPRIASGQLNGKMIVTTPSRDVGDRRRERRSREYLVVVEARRDGRRLMEAADQDERVDGRLEPGLAVLADEQLGALVGVALEPCERGERELHALGRRQRRPGGPRLVRGADGVERIGGGCCGGVTDHLAVRRVVDREGIGGRPLLASDQQRRGHGARSQRRTSLSIATRQAEPEYIATQRAGRSRADTRSYLRCPDMVHLELGETRRQTRRHGVLRGSMDDGSGGGRGRDRLGRAQPAREAQRDEPDAQRRDGRGAPRARRG